MPELSLVAESAPGARVETASAALLVVDDRRRCVEVSAQACAMLGLEREEIVGGRVDRLLNADARERLELFWRAFRGEGGHAGPFELARPSRAARSIDLSLTEALIPGRQLILISASSQGGAQEEGRAATISHLNGPRRGRGPSAREREVLALLTTGATDPQIAEQLELSPATIQTHVRNAKSKLGARTRAQAIAMAIRQGLIEV